MSTEHKSNTPESIRDLWQTPPKLFEQLNKEFSFTCDVAASRENRLCKMYFDEAGNALNPICDWFDSNWCNPPYSKILPWVQKARIEHEKGKTIVMLVPADTSVKWFKEAYESCNEVRFISGRLSFINADTQKPVSGNNKGSVLFIWRAHCKSHCVSLVDRGDYE
jgi:phage N-6-adenine-methyltransferase